MWMACSVHETAHMYTSYLNILGGVTHNICSPGSPTIGILQCSGRLRGLFPVLYNVYVCMQICASKF